MWKVLGKIVVTILATLGVLFIIIMLLPEDSSSEGPSTRREEREEEETEDDDADDKNRDEEDSESKKDRDDKKDPDEEESDSDGGTGEEQPSEEGEDKDGDKDVEIPESEISGNRLVFDTVSLDGEAVNQDIFSGHDLTVIYVWGTFNEDCGEELEKLAGLNKSLPDNVQLLGIVFDTYEGIDNNVPEAEKILQDSGAEFLNLRNSDGIHHVTGQPETIPAAIFTDGKGNLVGEMIEGAQYKDIEEKLENYLK